MKGICKTFFLIAFFSVPSLFCHAQDTLKKNDDNSETKYQVVETMPQFPGGENAMMQFIARNIKYPGKARRKNIQGKIYIKFCIDTNGDVTDPIILRGIGGGCDEEALRVIKLMPRWTPGTQGGKPVRVVYNLPINFWLK